MVVVALKDEEVSTQIKPGRSGPIDQVRRPSLVERATQKSGIGGADLGEEGGRSSSSGGWGTRRRSGAGWWGQCARVYSRFFPA